MNKFDFVSLILHNFENLIKEINFLKKYSN